MPLSTILQEFKEFAIRGNVIDMAVGIIVGAAFTGIVNSFVKDVFMPPISLLVGGAGLPDRFIVLRGASDYTTLADATAAGAITLNYGVFLNAVVSFLIVSFFTFLMVKQINRLRRLGEKGETPTPTTRPCPECLGEIPKIARRCRFCGVEVGVEKGEMGKKGKEVKASDSKKD